jgi:hypothetical protein
MGAGGGTTKGDPYDDCVHDCEDKFNKAQTATLLLTPEVASVVIEAARKLEEKCIIGCAEKYDI